MLAMIQTTLHLYLYILYSDLDQMAVDTTTYEIMFLINNLTGWTTYVMHFPDLLFDSSNYFNCETEGKIYHNI